MRRLAWTFAARIGDKYQNRLTRSIFPDLGNRWLDSSLWLFYWYSAVTDMVLLTVRMQKTGATVRIVQSWVGKVYEEETRLRAREEGVGSAAHTFVVSRFTALLVPVKGCDLCLCFYVSNWARPWENMSYAICEQQRRRSACASAQSHQRLCCSLLRQNDTSSFYIRNFKILAGLYSWAGQFMFCLVGDSRRHIFSWRGSFVFKDW